MNKKNSEQTNTLRPPVVAIMGHVDHGKSTLLDYIRKSNIVAGEAGGITQHISAYEATHTESDGTEKKITFIDTPGHAAFSDMRNRGASIADIAILIVSAEDGVKAQTIEAIKTIKKSNVPFVVAINKIDKPNAHPDQVKTELMEHEVFLEGYGGNIPFNEISSKTGQGVEDLLATILLVAELEELTCDTTKPATGFVVEAHLDQKRGVSATLIIKNGSVKKGEFIVVNDSVASTRIMESFLGESIDYAECSSPIIVTGFNNLPEAGTTFTTHSTKKGAEQATQEHKSILHEISEKREMVQLEEGQILIPIILKTDVVGMQQAIESEIMKLKNSDVLFKIIKVGVGAINESDIHTAMSDENTIVLGFNVPVDKKIATMNEADMVTIKTFDIIYKMIEWLEEEREHRRPRKEVETITASAKLLKTFSSTKNNHVVGGRVENGTMSVGDRVKITRNGIEIERGKIINLQQGKFDAKKIESGNEFGMILETNTEPAPGDVIESFTIETI